MAAAAKLTFCDGRGAFDRSELLKEMSSATSFFEVNHRKNLSHYLRRLLAPKRLIERSKDVYVLPRDARNELAQRLGIQDVVPVAS
jgi:hypothetical protein